MPRKVTLAEVADAAGVGVATVSRAMSGHPDVSAATQDRVREVAKRLGYRPSAAARALKAGSYHEFTVIVPTGALGWWGPFIQTAFEAAAAEGYRISVFPVGTEDDAAAMVDTLSLAPTEGVLVCTGVDQERVRRACDQLGLPVVALDDASRDVVLPTVAVASRQGAAVATTHLIERGARSIVLCGGSGDWYYETERLAGYRDALEAAGIPFREELVIDCATDFSEADEDLPPLAGLLASGVPIDAVFCIGDVVAPAAFRTLRKHGLSVPDDVAVAGFDDERAAVLVDPQLTTLRQPYEAMANAAMDLLLRQIRREPVAAERLQLPGTLIVRASA
ncbi:LacI family DNA-binding transcriptional regulator [Microbacterium sp. X-17]|uniref:LacI family DNA-binding transcriptional regulator n=1 Tax=Microbacterium sp. X-17 TaxID=3144404 RepID=UPI0031F5BEB8